MAILVIFGHFSGKVCSYFRPLPLSASPNMMHFVGYAQFRLCVLKATKAYCNEEVRNYGKILFIQSIVENGWCGGRMHTSHPPLDPPLTGTLLFQTDDSRVSQDRMRYFLFHSCGRIALATC